MNVVDQDIMPHDGLFFTHRRPHADSRPPFFNLAVRALPSSAIGSLKVTLCAFARPSHVFSIDGVTISR
jgi:hypothetical protein